jgi:CubicO group peptidase (beta-lactamase class C family)
MSGFNLDTLITAQLQQHTIPGCAVALVVGNTIAYSRTFGYRPSSRQSVTPRTLFQAASLTKPLFAYTVLQLCEAGQLDLDVPLSQLYTDAAITTDAARQITARHVLTHTTGLPNWREELNQHDLVPQSPPGTRFSYSGEGFEYLQRTVEYLTGLPLARYVEQSLFAPLGMATSRMQWGVDAAGREHLDVDGIAAATGARTVASAAWSLLTTAQDYVRFLRAIIVPDHSAVALRPTTRAAILTPHQRVGRHAHLHWGLGWGLQSTTQGWCLWHWGGPQNGYTSYASVLLSQQRGVVVLTNSNNGLPACQAIAQVALDVEQPAFDWLLPVETWHPEGC